MDQKHIRQASLLAEQTNNPYRLSLYDYEREILTFDHFEADSNRAKKLASQSNCILEIGSGSGMHLINRAKKNPNQVYLGVELRFKRSVRTIQKAQKASLENIYILRTNAINLPEIFDEPLFSGIYLNFPDPWAKRKQKKNRIYTSEFIRELSLLIKLKGFFSLKTDHLEYFRWIASELKQVNQFEIKDYTEDLYQSDYLSENVPTEFEGLFLSQNLPINYLKAEKNG